ncbi:MAG: hypothetical protein ACFFBD_28205 [Candidatus Hodarchaeota archaeon]
MLREKVIRITKLIVEKLEVVQAPKDGDLCVVVHKSTKDESYSVRIAVGHAIRYPAAFDISGYVFEEKNSQFIQSRASFVYMKLPHYISILCGVAKEGFPRSKGEKKLENKFPTLSDVRSYVLSVELSSLDDLIDILEKM